jgi:hypothetical protein
MSGMDWAGWAHNNFNPKGALSTQVTIHTDRMMEGRYVTCTGRVWSVIAASFGDEC